MAPTAAIETGAGRVQPGAAMSPAALTAVSPSDRPVDAGQSFRSRWESSIASVAADWEPPTEDSIDSGAASASKPDREARTFSQAPGRAAPDLSPGLSQAKKSLAGVPPLRPQQTNPRMEADPGVSQAVLQAKFNPASAPAIAAAPSAMAAKKPEAELSSTRRAKPVEGLHAAEEPATSQPQFAMAPAWNIGSLHSQVASPFVLSAGSAVAIEAPSTESAAANLAETNSASYAGRIGEGRERPELPAVANTRTASNPRVSSSLAGAHDSDLSTDLSWDLGPGFGNVDSSGTSRTRAELSSAGLTPASVSEPDRKSANDEPRSAAKDEPQARSLIGLSASPGLMPSASVQPSSSGAGAAPAASTALPHVAPSAPMAGASDAKGAAGDGPSNGSGNGSGERTTVARPLRAGIASAPAEQIASAHQSAPPPNGALPIRDLAQISVATPAPVEAGGSVSSHAPMSTEDAFTALDSSVADAAPTWLHAGAQRAEAGYQDPALGWVSVRAGLEGGNVHASLVPGSADAASALGGHLAELNTYLAAHHSEVAAVTLAAPESRAGESAIGMSSNQTTQHGTGQSADTGTEQGSRHGTRPDANSSEQPEEGIGTVAERSVGAVHPLAIDIQAASTRGAGVRISVMA